MAIIFDDKLVAAWYLKTLPTQDWMAGLREVEPDAKYELTYRFRYYEDGEVFDSKDERHWYQGEVTGTRNFCMLSLRSVAETLAAATIPVEGDLVGKVFELVNDKGIKDFMRRWADMPFVFMREVGKEEASKIIDQNQLDREQS